VEHAEFVAACRRGELVPVVEPALAARTLSARLLLPFVRLPVLGAGVALALVGWIVSGIALIALGILLPRLVARIAPQVLLDEALASEARFRQLVESGVLRLPAEE
jgi:hypothetical protein